MENIKNQLNELIRLFKKNIEVKEILTLSEAADYLSLSKSALYKLTSSKEIPHYIPGGKMIYFKKSEINLWINNAKVLSINELDENVEQYLKRTNKI